MVHVPDLQYKSEEEALTLLAENGLTGEKRQEASSDVEAGRIIRQEIAAGENIEKGSTVVFYVSTGAPPKTPAAGGNNKNTNRTQATPKQTQAAPQQSQAPAQTPAPTQAPPQTQPPTQATTQAANKELQDVAKDIIKWDN